MGSKKTCHFTPEGKIIFTTLQSKHVPSIIFALGRETIFIFQVCKLAEKGDTIFWGCSWYKHPWRDSPEKRRGSTSLASYVEMWETNRGIVS